MQRLVAAALFLVMLAGCSGPESDPLGDTTATSPAPETGAAPAPSAPAAAMAGGQTRVFWVNGTFDAYSTMIGGAGSKHVVSIPVLDNTTYIGLALTWTSADGTQDLDPAIILPGCKDLEGLGCSEYSVLYPVSTEGLFVNGNGGPGTPDSPASVDSGGQDIQNTPCNADPCEWRAAVLSHTPVEGMMEFSLRIELRDSP